MKVIVYPCAWLALALLGCAGLPHRGGANLEGGARYVAMGSSFAAGAGIGPIKPGTPDRCRRTFLNYPSLLAQRLNLDLVDVSCGGATTAHILGPWRELPAQLDAVNENTRLVTITIGGNDLGYVAGLMGASCRALEMSANCPVTAAPAEADYGRVAQNLRDIAAEVTRRAPNAQLVFVQYVTLVPPTPCEQAPLAAEDALVSREIGQRLAAITARVARDTGSLLIPMDQISVDHTACSQTPWSRGMASAGDAARASPWHPTIEGMRAVADAVATRLTER